MLKLLSVLFLAAATFFLAGCVTPPPGETAPAGVKFAKRQQPSKGKRMVVRTTAYTHTEVGGAKNAIGSRLRFGGATTSAASDWSWLPLGTRFRMVSNGRIYVIEDYGSALVGRKTVDLYKPTRKAMKAWGVRHEEIEILEWGSKAMSLKLLKPRQGNKHVRRMVASLQTGGAGI